MSQHRSSSDGKHKRHQQQEQQHTREATSRLALSPDSHTRQSNQPNTHQRKASQTSQSRPQINTNTTITGTTLPVMPQPTLSAPLHGDKQQPHVTSSCTPMIQDQPFEHGIEEDTRHKEHRGFWHGFMAFLTCGTMGHT